MKYIAFYLLVVFALFSCDKLEPEPEIEPLVADKFEENDFQEDAVSLCEAAKHSLLTISEGDDVQIPEPLSTQYQNEVNI